MHPSILHSTSQHLKHHSGNNYDGSLNGVNTKLPSEV